MTMKNKCVQITSLRFVFFMSLLWLAGCAAPSYRGYKYSPYTLRGVHYVPMAPKEALGFEEEGIASHYKGGSFFFRGKTAIGEKLGSNTPAVAHKTLPLPCKIRLTNLQNGRSMIVRVNDRGPFIEGRNIDVTAPIAKKLGFYKQGITPVKIKVLSVGDGKYLLK